jgi:predicted Zn-dependent protease with MMP-like domain
MQRFTFPGLLALAESELGQLTKSLPPQLQQAVSKIAVVLEDRPGPSWIAEGVDKEQLGLFEGVGSEDPSHHHLPRMVLWLGNIWELCNGDLEVYREEVRVTFLHELGHYLGLDEEDLEERDLA